MQVECEGTSSEALKQAAGLGFFRGSGVFFRGFVFLAESEHRLAQGQEVKDAGYYAAKRRPVRRCHRRPFAAIGDERCRY